MRETVNTSPKKIRVALFGAGKMAMHHAMAIGMQGNATLIAVADPVAREGDNIEAFGSEAVLYSTAEELLSKEKPDVVHVCTPPDTHFELTRLALLQGSHVYVEKPFTLLAREAREIISMAEAKGLRVCAGHQLLHETPALRAEGSLCKLGRIVHIESYFSFRPVRRSRDGRSTLSPLEQLVDILPHPTYLLLHFLRRDHERGDGQVEIRALEVKASGYVHGILRYGDVTGILTVTLEGRPVESYLKVVGTNGCLYADFVRGSMILLPGPGVSSISKVLNPYRQSWQIFSETTKALSRRFLKKQKSYPGLYEIIRDFYGGIISGRPVLVSHTSIIETVALCEEVGTRLKHAEKEENAAAEIELRRLESCLPDPDGSHGFVLVTGGSGFLGKAVAAELRRRNQPTRIVTRRVPSYKERIPGVEYVEADLGDPVSASILTGVDTVVHCAAETAGGKEAHERNSVGATRNVLEAMQKAGVSKLVHVSSIAVLKTGRESGKPVDEDTPLALGDEDRGPYVWGKAESEKLATELSEELGIKIRVIRPGPLVTYENFDPPGRLGREFGPYFILIGNRRSTISVCTLETAAKVIYYYVDKFESMPKFLNLVEQHTPTREKLAEYLLQQRPDLKIFRIPFGFIYVLSPVLKYILKVAFPKKKSINVYNMFKSEKYNSSLAEKVLNTI